MILEDSSRTGDFSPAARESGEEIAGGDEKRNLASECGEPGVVSQADADRGMMGAQAHLGRATIKLWTKQIQMKKAIMWNEALKRGIQILDGILVSIMFMFMKGASTQANEMPMFSLY